MARLNFAKYKGIIASVALFILLDASVLMLNFYISFQIADDAKVVNVAAKQGMLTQRMLTNLYSMQHANLYLLKDTILSQSKELAETQQQFANTLEAFKQGSDIIINEQQQITLPKIESGVGGDAINKAEQLWLPYNTILSRLLNEQVDEYINVATLSEAIAYGQNNSEALIASLATVTQNLESVASAKAERLRTIQIIGISLAVINFFFIMMHFMRQLSESDAVIDQARGETQEILDTVNEGLFLLDKEQMLSSQHSKELASMLGEDNLAGQSFREVLANLVSAKDLLIAQEYIDSLFNPRVHADLIKDLNPLNEIKINIKQQNGQFISKYLSFDFTRVDDNSGIKHILVSVKDMTDTVLLAQQLDQAKQEGEAQLEMLLGIIHTNQDLLTRFLNESLSTFSSINETLKNPSKTQTSLRIKAQEIFAEIHNFKGEASALELESFAYLAHQFEDELSRLINKIDLDGNDFLSLTVKLDELINYSQSIIELNAKLKSIASEQTSQSHERSTHSSQSALQKLFHSLCERHGKQANFACVGFDEVEVSTEQFDLIHDISIQLLRNAICHGIESQQARHDSEKPATARIDCRLIQLGNHLELTFEDDGAGIDYEKIKQKAVEQSLYTAEQIEHLNKRQLAGLMFSPGFSTAKEVSVDAGRGMGMDIIKQRINQAGGKLTIASRKNQFTRFTITLPIAHAQRLVA